MRVPAAGTAGARRQPGRPGAGPRPTVRRLSAPRRPARGRTPFAVLVVVLLAAGLIGLLTLNTALNQGSFELSRLQSETTRLTDEQQSLEQQIAQLSAPDALERRARGLGMVPGGSPAFLRDDGTVLGKPGKAVGTPPVTRSSGALWSVPSPSPQAAAPAPAGADGAIQAAPAAAGGAAR
ncbi:septum formation initiator family protein [Streptomyces sp. NPDC001380]|uniref:FtsB family cell division protein n=1 Tax=Streptomyces sp. NPDC001380 TaxID=3364566 RepID=UPI0036B53B06